MELFLSTDLLQGRNNRPKAAIGSQCKLERYARHFSAHDVVFARALQYDRWRSPSPVCIFLLLLSVSYSWFPSCSSLSMVYLKLPLLLAACCKLRAWREALLI